MRKTTMRKTILIVLAAALMAASATQIAAAGERHHLRKTDRSAAAEPFRNANNSMSAPSAWPYSGFSAPAGH
jgi:hypothetical protein